MPEYLKERRTEMHKYNREAYI